MTNQNDILRCGNCNYDNGVEHLKQEQVLHNRIAKLELQGADDPAVRMVKAVAMTIAVIIMTITLAWSASIVYAPAPNITNVKNIVQLTPVMVAYDRVSKSYDQCMTHARDARERENCLEKLSKLQETLMKKLDEEALLDL